MGHLPKLIEDLALILIAGAITTLLFKKIRQPLVLGYIIAGFLVGPHFSLFPTVVDTENVETLAEIGVIFLLFSLGLEFSFKKLMKVGGTASITAFIEIIFITTAGFFSGRLMGWNTMDSLFLGGMLASSSTTIIIRAFDELNVKTRQFARIVFGVLVVEDIVVILLMVLLSTMAVSKQFQGAEMMFTIVKLLFFLALWFIAGIFLLPTFLKRAKKLLDDETLLILAIGLCLGMVVLATQVGFSAELGAFIMGSIIAETTSAEKVEHLIQPVKHLFGSVFFISVGMLIDPKMIMDYIWPVLIVTGITLFGKMFSTTAGALVTGQSLRQSIQVGMSMAQIGEFAFIIATLGLTLGVTSDFLFPVAVGASAITTFTTPYLIRFSDPFYRFIVRILPGRWVRAINNYSSNTQDIQAESDWKIVIKSYASIVLTNGIVLLALFLVSVNFVFPFIHRRIPGIQLANITNLVISLGMASPFIWALIAKRPDNMAYKELWLRKDYSRGPLLAIEIVRILLGIAIIAIWVERIFTTGVAILIAVPLIVVFLFIFSRKIQHFYRRIERRFLKNLNARDIEAAGSNSVNEYVKRKSEQMQADLLPWDVHIVPLEVGQLAPFAGSSLKELQWREQFGINVVYIKRGELIIPAPGRDEMILPFDQIGVIATDEQIQQFKPMFDKVKEPQLNRTSVDEIVLQKIVVDEHTRLKGQTLRNSGIRERTNGLVVGIEREGQRILNPDSTMEFQWNDIVWLVGERKKIQDLFRTEF